MSRAPSTFRQQDITRAFKAARAAGVEIARIEIDPVTKRIIIVPLNGAAPKDQPSATEGNEWDRVVSADKQPNPWDDALKA